MKIDWKFILEGTIYGVLAFIALFVYYIAIKSTDWAGPAFILLMILAGIGWFIAWARRN